MSEKKVDAEIVRKQCANDTSLIDEAEIIDVSAFNFDDTNGWLYVPTEFKTESTVHDLYTWLRGEPELNLSANRKSIDTRTFTRSKKRSSRTSFESILESLSSPLSNTWRTSNISNIEEDLSKCADIPTANKEETVPPMLKMAPNSKASLLADEAGALSGQESMEVFLNMSQSKGIDSFINLMEPGISDPLMNVSQPSIFYSSITSLPRDDFLHNTECDKDEEPVNLTDLCIQKLDKLEATQILNMNETFSKLHKQDINKSYSLNGADKTFTNDPVSNKIELNETYDADVASAMVVLPKSNKDKFSTTLSSTFVNKDSDTTKILQLEKEPNNLNATFASGPAKENNSFVLDTTYSAKDIEIASNDVTCTIQSAIQHDKNQTIDLQNNAIHNATKIIGASSPVGHFPFSPICEGQINSTFKLPISSCNQSTPISSTLRTINKQLESRVYNTSLSSNMKAPTMLRKELLAEIYKSGDHKLDCTFEHVAKDHQNGMSRKEAMDEVPNQNPKNDIPVENKYNTYKKESSVNKMKVHSEIINEAGVCAENFQDKKYYTFTKKGNGTHGGKTDMENAETSNNVDTTFVKPLPKLQKQKQHIPKMLSKLPQFLQKSNPNLVSNSLKTVNTTGGRNTAGFGYMKGSQPNIVRDVEKSLGSKLYSFAKLKSGSEQRLLELNSGVDLQLLRAGGSTESIESTQSAHSAPDLDDRLSTCSDCSHNSYTTRPMNIEQLHQIVRMQEESLKQATAPRLNKRVLENTWTDINRDLPSPILKDNVDGFENDTAMGEDYTVKTSSPILSPTRSSQSINTDGHPTETVSKQQNESDATKVETFNKPMMKIENKTTRLRQPMNWNTGNRPPNQTSAIPRPPSRIPGPRFMRPTVKNVQGDPKRGYM